MKTEQEQRQAVVAEALSWLGTRYLHEGNIKRAGVDCGMLLVRVFVDAGIVEPFDPRPYSRSWMMHQLEEKYLSIVQRYAHEIFSEPKPGDVVLWRVGKLYAHGGIVSQWPKVIHAFARARMVIQSDLSLKGAAEDIPRRAFSCWGSAGG